MRITIFMLLFTGLAMNPTKGQLQQPCQSDYSDDFIIIQNISENWPVNTPLTHLVVFGDNSEILLAMTSSNDFIKFNSTTRDLVVYSHFVVTGATTMNINLNIVCNILSTNQKVYFQVLIVVWDMNDNPPYFLNLPYSVNVSERTAVINSTIFSDVMATDQDACDIGYLVFSVADTGPYSSMFTFPVSTIGKLVLSSQLEYDQVHTINLTLLVKDNGFNLTILGQLQPQHTATTSIIINIIAADDYNPTFNQSSYDCSIQDNTEPNVSLNIVPPISANIEHSLESLSIVYSIVQDPINDDASNFVIDTTTGVISTSWLSNFTRVQTLAFQIQATVLNEDYRYGRALVKVMVKQSLQPLTFTQKTYMASFGENVPIGTLVVTVAAITISDQNSPLTYYFSPKETVTEFNIDSKTGEVRTTNNLNYSISTNFSLTVMATNGQTTVNCSLIVILYRFSNPQFVQQIYIFNITTDQFIGRVQATDADSDSILSYRLLDNSQSFVIDNNGEIRLNGPSSISFPHSMAVIVEDGENPPRQDTALIVLTRNGEEVTPATTPLSVSFSPQPVVNREGEFNLLTIIIILGVLVGALTLIIVVVIIVFCICRKSREKIPQRERITIEYGQTPSTPKDNRMGGVAIETGKDYDPSSPPVEDSDEKKKKRSKSTERIEKYYDYEGAGYASQSSTVKSPPRTYSPTTTASDASTIQQQQQQQSLSPGRRAVTGPSSRTPGHRMMTGGSYRGDGSRVSNNDTSSTETLVTPISTITKTSNRPKISNISFVDNPTATGGYQSSQEAIDVSMSALQGVSADGESGITVYY